MTSEIPTNSKTSESVRKGQPRRKSAAGNVLPVLSILAVAAALFVHSHKGEELLRDWLLEPMLERWCPSSVHLSYSITHTHGSEPSWLPIGMVGCTDEEPVTGIFFPETALTGGLPEVHILDGGRSEKILPDRVIRDFASVSPNGRGLVAYVFNRVIRAAELREGDQVVAIEGL